MTAVEAGEGTRRSIFDMSFKEALVEAAKRHPGAMKAIDESLHEFPPPNRKDDSGAD